MGSHVIFLNSIFLSIQFFFISRTHSNYLTSSIEFHQLLQSSCCKDRGQANQFNHPYHLSTPFFNTRCYADVSSSSSSPPFSILNQTFVWYHLYALRTYIHILHIVYTVCTYKQRIYTIHDLMSKNCNRKIKYIK